MTYPNLVNFVTLLAAPLIPALYLPPQSEMLEKTIG